MDNLTLDEKLIHIGVRISGEPKNIKKRQWVDIEGTIYEATFEFEKDPRLFLVLCSWVKFHGDYVVIEKLMKLQKREFSPWLVALAIIAKRDGHSTWGKLIKKVDGEYALSPLNIIKQMIDYKGADDELKKFGFLIAKDTIRIRESDVATPQKLIKENNQYRNRYVHGPNWRADIITAIQSGFENPYRITQAIGCSYPSAYRIFKDYKLAVGS